MCVCGFNGDGTVPERISRGVSALPSPRSHTVIFYIAVSGEKPQAKQTRALGIALGIALV